MAAKGSECSTSLNDSSDLPSRQTNSASSSIKRLSFSLPDGFDSSLNEHAEIEIVPEEEDVRNPDVQNISHHQSFRRPLSVENFTVDEVGLSQSRHGGSIGRTSSLGASLWGLFSLSSVLRLPEDVESEFVSQAGDIGDRVLSNRASHRESASFSIDNGVVFPVPEELLESYGFWNHDSSKLNVHSPVSPLTSEIISSPFINALLHKKQAEGERQAPSFDYIACLVLLAAFGILGVLTRYLLQKLLGPGVADVTSDQSILYLDLPSNMVGSFLMGWFGIVFKADISRFSEQLAIGLSTGYLGSLTTFSSWNQKMLDLSVNGKWVFAVVGFVIGLFLAAYSMILGVETAKGFRWLLRRSGIDSNVTRWRVNISKQHLIVLLALLIWGGLWTTSGVLERKEFKNGGNDAQLWLGCLVSPFGVWIRWWLARLNGSGLGKAGWFKWMPFGTLITNVAAACIMAALATIKKAVNTKNCDTIATGIQFGLLGCLSTVSTFMAEFHAMRQTTHPWRSYVYAFMTIGFSFGLGTLIFSVPVWIKGYK